MKAKKKSYGITNQRLVQKKYMSFNALQISARESGLKTKYQYEKWVKNEKPLSVPLYPYRVYEEWTTWGDFLGTDNIFIPYDTWIKMREKNWKTYWEATRWVQKQNYKTSMEFLTAYHKGEVPRDIPRAPYQVYRKDNKGGWTGWKAFLGTTIQKKVEVMQNIQKLFAITNVTGYPNNYFRIIVAQEGKEHLIEQLDTRARARARASTIAFRTYVYDEEKQMELGRIVSQVASHQGSGIYLCNNMNSLFFELDSSFTYDMKLTREITEKMKQNGI